MMNKIDPKEKKVEQLFIYTSCTNNKVTGPELSLDLIPAKQQISCEVDM